MSLPPSSAPTATGWSDSCRAGFAPAEEWRLVTTELPMVYGPVPDLPLGRGVGEDEPDSESTWMFAGRRVVHLEHQRRARLDQARGPGLEQRDAVVPDGGSADALPIGACSRYLLWRLLGPAEVRAELRLPASWRLRKRAGDRSPVADHGSQRERRFDGARDLVQHELEVTPRAAGAPGPAARRSPRGKLRGRGGAASPPAAPRTVSRRATPWRCRRRTSAGAPTAPAT